MAKIVVTSISLVFKSGKGQALQLIFTQFPKANVQWQRLLSNHQYYDITLLQCLGHLGQVGHYDTDKAVFPLENVSMIMPATAKHNSDTQQSLLTCLGHLGWHDINRNDPICVALPKVAKASKAVAQNRRWFC